MIAGAAIIHRCARCGVKTEIIQEGGPHANRRDCDIEHTQRIEVYDLDVDVDGFLDRCGRLWVRLVSALGIKLREKS
jgi:hypothetical protein